MPSTPPFELKHSSARVALLHDLRHALFAIRLTPLLLEKYRNDASRFHTLCEELTHECETVAALIEEEFAAEEEGTVTKPGTKRAP